MKPVPLVVANWKMNHTATRAAEFADRLRPLLAPIAGELGSRFEVAIAPAFPALERLGRALAGSGVSLAAQNLHEASAGAFTGEVSLAMLEDLDCRFVLVGHSERRQSFGESDQRIAAKLERVLPSKLCAVLCIGETLAEREAGALASVLERQLADPIRLVAASGRPPGDSLVVAYEPVWAIGTGRVATPDLAQAAHAEIRRRLISRLGQGGEQVRILYGGSVKPANARSLLEQPDVDGALVGGASLDPGDFSSIVSTCRETQLERS
jgi:triosephosphate isomerase (TIM)